MTSDPAAPRAVLAGHGDFAAGLASAVAQISGVDDAFVVMSNRGRSGDEILRTLRDALDANALRVIFTDLPAGSCTIAARRLQRERPELILVTGVNLATLLDFVFAADAGAAAAAHAVEHAVQKGRDALAVAPGAPSGGSAGGARGAA